MSKGKEVFISIEGCIGSGKTTIAKLLAVERNSNLILEQFEDNPFLKQFYSDPSKYALETELAFILIHYHELFHDFPEVKDSDCISDFHVAKDLIFAEMNLDSENLIIFENLYTSLTERLPVPDVVVCLQCSDKLLLKRIEERKRNIETHTTPQYFIKLNRLYKEYFKKMELPKICVDMDDRDFVEDSSQIEWLSERIDHLSKVSTYNAPENL